MSAVSYGQETDRMRMTDYGRVVAFEEYGVRSDGVCAATIIADQKGRSCVPITYDLQGEDGMLRQAAFILEKGFKIISCYLSEVSNGQKYQKNHKILIRQVDTIRILPHARYDSLFANVDTTLLYYRNNWSWINHAIPPSRLQIAANVVYNKAMDESKNRVICYARNGERARRLRIFSMN